MTDAGALLVERGNKHGDFTHGAQFTQDVMDILTAQTNWRCLKAFEKEGIHMIVHKMQRVLSGDYRYDDHWLDVEGYARVIRQRIELSDHSGMAVFSAAEYNRLLMDVTGVFRRQLNWPSMSDLQQEASKCIILGLAQWISGRKSNDAPWQLIEIAARKVYLDIRGEA